MVPFLLNRIEGPRAIRMLVSSQAAMVVSPHHHHHHHRQGTMMLIGAPLRPPSEHHLVMEQEVLGARCHLHPWMLHLCSRRREETRLLQGC